MENLKYSRIPQKRKHISSVLAKFQETWPMSLWFAPPIKQSTFLEKGEWVGNVNPYNEAGLSAHYQSVLSKFFKND